MLEANIVEVARQAGHSPTVTLSTYAHLFEELEGAERRSAENEIRRAKRLVRGADWYPNRGPLLRTTGGKSCRFTNESQRPDSSGVPLHYEGRTSRGRASTRGFARPRSRWKLSGSSAHAVDAGARSFPS